MSYGRVSMGTYLGHYGCIFMLPPLDCSKVHVPSADALRKTTSLPYQIEVHVYTYSYTFMPFLFQRTSETFCWC